MDIGGVTNIQMPNAEISMVDNNPSHIIIKSAIRFKSMDGKTDRSINEITLEDELELNSVLPLDDNPDVIDNPNAYKARLGLKKKNL